VAFRNIAEVNKGPLTSTRKGLSVIPFRFLTGASVPSGVVSPGNTAVTSESFSVSRTSSTVYVVTIPGTRIAASTAYPANLSWFWAELNTAQYVSSAVFATVATNNTTTITITLSGAPADGTQVRGVIKASMVGIA
jgi:hypothetical protein